MKYPELFPLEPTPKLVPAHISLVRERLAGIDFRKGVILLSTQDLMKTCFLYGILSIGEEVSFKMMNAYGLIEILLGLSREEDAYTAISQLEHRVVALYLGYSEMENRRQSDVIEQLFSLSSTRGPIRRVSSEYETSHLVGQAVWLFFKGSLSHMTKQYPNVLGLAKDLGYSIVDLNVACSTTEEEI